MMPDGIFDSSRGEQLIGIFYTCPMPNVHEVMRDVRTFYFTLETSPASGIIVPLLVDDRGNAGSQVHDFNRAHLKMGKNFLKFFRADFSHVEPGKHRIRLLAWEGDVPTPPSKPGRHRAARVRRRPDWDIEKTIFGAKTSFNKANGALEIECPEGKLSQRHQRLHVFPYLPAGEDPRNWKKFVARPIYDPVEQVYTNSFLIADPPLMLPRIVVAEMLPAKPFTGKFSALPFEDAWWKILGWILTALFAGGAGYGGYVAARGGETEAKEWDDSNFDCYPESPGHYVCGLVVLGAEKGYSSKHRKVAGTLGGLSGALASCAFTLGMADRIDPFRAGENSTEPAANEKTTREVVRAEFKYIGNPIPGEPHTIQTEWQFVRYTDKGKKYTHSETWQEKNDYIKSEVKTDKEQYKIGEERDDVVRITAVFTNKNGYRLKGRDLYVTALVIGPMQRFAWVSMMDDEATGHYSASVVITEILPLMKGYAEIERNGRIGVMVDTTPPNTLDAAGKWRVLVIAQNVNTATGSEAPEVMAQFVGGRVLTTIFDAHLWEDCQIRLKTHATFMVRQVIG
jgi:hypothetical protein